MRFRNLLPTSTVTLFAVKPVLLSIVRSAILDDRVRLHGSRVFYFPGTTRIFCNFATEITAFF